MAGVFSGTYSHSLDGKGRVIIPAVFREKLGTGFAITLNSTIDALAVYPAPQWEALSQQLASVRNTDDDAMDYRRHLLANAQADMDMDVQGRVLLPQPLRDAVDLTRDITFVGMLDFVEIWDAAAYAEKSRQTKLEFSRLRNHVKDNY